MAAQADHFTQAQRNLQFLGSINNHQNEYTDWQVTVCFYVAVHLANGHLSQFGLQYRTHSDVNFALNPYYPFSVSKLPEAVFNAYISLYKLSRRSRYLVNPQNPADSQAHFTNSKHLAKATRHLDFVLQHFAETYRLHFSPVHILCPDLKPSDNLHFFSV